MTGLSPLFSLEAGGQRWTADTRHAIDLSIALDFHGPQPAFFGAATAQARALSAGTFVGDVRSGGSCNCSSYSLTPHCNGTHTECVGHVTEDRVSIRDIAIDHLSRALLVSVTPEAVNATDEHSIPTPQRNDRLITRKALQSAASASGDSACSALIVRTLPNTPDKKSRSYDADQAPPYFTIAAMQWIVDHNFRHLLVDLPSIDRAADEGHLTAHRLFWGLPPGITDSRVATRAAATITELIYVDNGVVDGVYLLNLQVAPFVADAAPSRPILYPLVGAQ